MANNAGNTLLSTARASDTSPIVQLHPLVLLTISDCISRHTLRQQPGPVVGAILGAQNGQEITMEVAFQAKLVPGADGEVTLDDEWFSKRLEDCKSTLLLMQYFWMIVITCSQSKKYINSHNWTWSVGSHLVQLQVLGPTFYRSMRA